MEWEFEFRRIVWSNLLGINGIKRRNGRVLNGGGESSGLGKKKSDSTKYIWVQDWRGNPMCSILPEYTCARYVYNYLKIKKREHLDGNRWDYMSRGRRFGFDPFPFLRKRRGCHRSSSSLRRRPSIGLFSSALPRQVGRRLDFFGLPFFNEGVIRSLNSFLERDPCFCGDKPGMRFGLSCPTTGVSGICQLVYKMGGHNGPW